MSEIDRSSTNIGWFLAGLGLGAVVGVLFAPKSGRELRSSIAQSAQEGREYLTNRSAQAKEHINEWVDRGRDYVNHQKENLGAAVEAGKQAFRHAKPEGEHHK